MKSCKTACVTWRRLNWRLTAAYPHGVCNMQLVKANMRDSGKRVRNSDRFIYCKSQILTSHRDFTMPSLWLACQKQCIQTNQSAANTAAERQNKTKAPESCVQTAPEEVTLSQRGSKSELKDPDKCAWYMTDNVIWMSIHRKYLFLLLASWWCVKIQITGLNWIRSTGLR